MVLPHTTLGQISIAPWTDRPPPRGKKKEKNKLNNKQAAEKKKTCSKEGGAPQAPESGVGAIPQANCK
jgi:hypothetical protein